MENKLKIIQYIGNTIEDLIQRDHFATAEAVLLASPPELAKEPFYAMMALKMDFYANSEDMKNPQFKQLGNSMTMHYIQNAPEYFSAHRKKDHEQN